LLRAVIGAGDDGLAFPSYCLGDAVLLALDDLVRTDRVRRRLYATDKGRAFALRVPA
ncbi:MAG: hypothetical protein JWQ97_3378, partial [Phenylobacterium sp.]|nr:hypothetical protein [Phenylobacterium sp.]